MTLEQVLDWFQYHVTLDGKPYTLDVDQARAVLDSHKNTLVTARAGSGKTRVIVAKVAYLVAKCQLDLSNIAVFMFNRTAATEVNQRIAGIRIDGYPLTSGPVLVASTFHKFALDIVKMTGEKPEIISEAEQSALVQDSLRRAITASGQKVPPSEYADLLKLTTSFITRAGQKYCGATGLTGLAHAIQSYLPKLSPRDQSTRIHQLAHASYYYYLEVLRPSRTDFNLLMTSATDLLEKSAIEQDGPIFQRFQNLRYILVDEYQDFSYLFFAIVRALRLACPRAHLFAVGDDWQAINRFAGSDVDYFLNFTDYFPEDPANIPLLTNYRSDRAIVENANDYMLAHYDPTARRAVPFSKAKGKITRLDYQKTRFDPSDYAEDRLGDGRYLAALFEALTQNATDSPVDPTSLPAASPARIKEYLPIAKLLKSVARIVKKHPREQIMLLHRHNFTSVPSITLPVFTLALKNFLAREAILPPAVFDRQIRVLTMHKSKGLESDVVILLESNRDQLLSEHPYATIFSIFGDSLTTEKADQHRLIYVALTRAKHRLYILGNFL